MKLLRCLLVLAVIAAASATFNKRVELSKTGKCGYYCGLTSRNYTPRRNNGKCLGVFGFLAVGVNAKLSLVIDIFGYYSNIEPAININAAVDTCINLSKGISIIIDQWVSGLGIILQNLIIGISRLLFCVLDHPWKLGHFLLDWLTLGHNKSPAICSNDFGVKWGWIKYLKGYNRDDIFEYYNLFDIEVQINAALSAQGLSIDKLTGTHKLIIDTMLKLNILLLRDFNSWKRSDYVEVIKYLITISAAVGSAYKAEIGIAIVDEYREYLSLCFEKEFKVDMAQETSSCKQELDKCDTAEFGIALKIDVDVPINIDANIDVI